MPDGAMVRRFAARLNETSSDVQVRAAHCHGGGIVIESASQARPIAPVPLGNVVGTYAASSREVSSRVQVLADHRQRCHTCVPPRPQSGPTAAVPLRNVSCAYGAEPREPSSHVRVAADHRDRLHTAGTYIRTQGGPIRAVPFRETVRSRHTAGLRESAAYVHVAAAHGDGADS